VDEYGRLIAAWQQPPKGRKTLPRKNKKKNLFLFAFLKRFLMMLLIRKDANLFPLLLNFFFFLFCRSNRHVVLVVMYGREQNEQCRISADELKKNRREKKGRTTDWRY